MFNSIAGFLLPQIISLVSITYRQFGGSCDGTF